MRYYATIILVMLSATPIPAQDFSDTTRTSASEQARNRFFGDLAFGISNYGMAGEAKVYHAWGNKFISAGYYQSHVCYAGEYNGIPFWKSGATTHHVSIHSYSAGFGYMLHRKLKQGISAGISINRISDELTDPILNDFSIDGVYRELAGEGFEDHSHGKHAKVVVGIPIEYKVFLFNKRLIGLDAAFRADLNMTMIFSAITLGVRIGK